MKLSRARKILNDLSNWDLNYQVFFLLVMASAPLLAYLATVYAQGRLDERRAQIESGKEQREFQDFLTNPKTGTTPELVAAVSVGMTGEEVQQALQYSYSLGIEVFPYNYSFEGVDWVSNEIPIKGVGYVQAVFVERELVGLGSLDPNVGRLCGGCLEDVLRGERSRSEGLPYHVNGLCPECGSEKVVPYGAMFAKYNRPENACCGVRVANLYVDGRPYP